MTQSREHFYLQLLAFLRKMGGTLQSRVSTWSANTTYLLVFLISLLSLNSFDSTAQTSATADQADRLYEQHAYKAAAKLYESADTDLVALEKLANSYRLNHDTEKAEIHYAELVRRTTNPIHFLHYAQALQSNGKLDLAKSFYLKYDRAISGEMDKRGSHKATAIDRLAQLKSEHYFFENAENINSEQSDFSPLFYQNGIVFVSTRLTDKQSELQQPKKDNWTGDGFSALYLTEFQEDGTLSLPEIFSTGLNTKFHEGPLAISNNGERLFYTINISPKKKKKKKEYFLKIGTAIKEGNRWLRDGLIDLGAENCNDVHPALSADGQLLIFASDRLGGYGGMDIYMVKFSNHRWGASH